MGFGASGVVRKFMRFRFLAVSMGCFIFALAVTASTLASGPQVDGPKAGLPPGLLEALASPPGLDDLAQPDPSTPAELSASRDAFRGLTTDEAVQATRQAFPGMLNALGYLPPQLSADERIINYPSPNVAQLSLGNGERGVIDSQLPLVTTTSSGDQVPVDLELIDRGSALEPTHPLVPLQIPKQLSEGIALVDSGLKITPTDSTGAPLESSSGAIEGATAFFANTQDDTDMLVRPLPAGFETDTQLRSPASPDRLYFRISAKTDLKMVKTDSGAVSISQDGNTIAVVQTPTAIDASGAPVPVSMDVSGGTLILSVDQQSSSYQYPIMVDPTVVDQNIWFGQGPQAWYYATDNASAFIGSWDTYYGGGSLASYDPGGSFTPGQYGAWTYTTQGISRIYKFDSVTEAPLSDYQTNNSVRIFGPPNLDIASWLGSYYPTPTGTTVCASSDCSTSGGTAHDTAMFEQFATGNGSGFYTRLDTGSVSIAQDTGPSVTFDKTDAQIGGYKNPLYGSGQWVRTADAATLQVNATDPGIGIYQRGILSTNYGSWNGGTAYGPASGCLGVQCDSPYNWTATVGNLPEGVNTVQATVANATGANAVATAQVKVDNAAPTITVSGLTSGDAVGQGVSNVHIVAADGTAPTVSSGIGNGGGGVSAWIDGSLVLGPSGTACSPGPCQVTRDYQLRGSDWGAGAHTLSITATDAAGNAATTDIPFVVNEGPMVQVGPGSVGVASGDYELDSQDVLEPGPGGGLSVQRSYQSRNISTGSPLGSSWQLSLGGWQSVTQMSNGTAEFMDAAGNPAVFASDGNGGYVAPPGYQGWTLKYQTSPKQSYTLTDLQGDVTTFTQPSGTGTVYVPTSASGPNGTNVTTFSFQTVNGITEPTQVLAPVPAGVSCTSLVRGCRALTFTYAISTTATSDSPSGWGDYNGHLMRVDFHAWDPASAQMVTKTVAQYSYDPEGRLRAEWNPQISPALKTLYGYDTAGHVTALTPPGQQPWLFSYGTVAGESSAGWFLAASRPSASTALGSNIAPQNTGVPTFSTTTPVVGVSMKAWNGTWSNSPASYAYQWQRCNSDGTGCAAISGATGQSYTPVGADAGHTLVVQVSAANSGGSISAVSSASSVVTGAPMPLYSSQFGSNGSGNGQFSNPMGAAADSSGNVWVVDNGNSRIEKFSPSGTFLAAYGSVGSGNGQLTHPNAIAIDKGSDNVYVVDGDNNRVEEFSGSGNFIRTFGSYGSGNGQFISPDGIAVDTSGNVWVSDGYNARVEEFSSAGTYLGAFGSKGSGNGQFTSPSGIAVSGGNLYVLDVQADRVQQFSSGGVYLGQFAGAGSGDGQFKTPTAITTDLLTGNLYVVDGGNNRVEAFDSTGAFLGEFGSYGSGNGQFKMPWGIAIGASGQFYVSDESNQRVEVWIPNTNQSNPPPPDPTTAIWTAAYHVPVSGSNVPYAMGSVGVAKWAQSDLPSDATAIFPPDRVPATPPTNYARATIYYMDSLSRNVNIAAPGGRITTKEYDGNSNVVRTLSAANRQTALNAGAGSAAQAKLLDTQFGYSADGTNLLDVLGPQHVTQLMNGSQVQARQHIQYTYDQNAPSGGPYHLVTTKTEGAQISGQPDADVRTTTYSYDGQNKLGWTLHEPTSTTVDPSGLQLTSTTLYDLNTGAVIESRKPGNPNGGDAHAQQTIYYTSGSNTVTACGGHPEWANLPCQTQPAAQPGTSGLPNLPTTLTAYNVWDEPLTVTDTVGATTRVSTNTYDNAGRPITSAITSPVGNPLPTETTGYDSNLGIATTQTTGTGGGAKVVTQTYNTLGQLTSYMDADGSTSSYTYDLDGRQKTVNDGKGTQTSTYDATTGDLASLQDSAVGTFAATYDANGNMTSESYPNGMTATYNYDSTDATTKVSYVKMTNCISNCTWFSDQLVQSIHGQSLNQASSLSSQNYSYDAAGRLTQVQDTSSGQGCTTDLYTYDTDTNRTSATTRPSNGDGSCATSGGSVQSNSFDSADRLTDSGVTYNTFGDITSLPAGDAGGNSLTSTYYVDDTLATQTQGGQTVSYNLDPIGRTRETITGGTGNSDVISHYADGGDSPAWTADSSGNWTRYINGIDGGFIGTYKSDGTAELEFTNLHGDVVGTASISQTAVGLTSTSDTTEFGVPRSGNHPKYSWLGADQRGSDLPSGVINMGARAYVPQLGRFEQPDPVPGGSANAYSYTYGDPVNQSDVSGEFTPTAPDYLAQYLGSPPNVPPAVQPGGDVTTTGASPIGVDASDPDYLWWLPHIPSKLRCPRHGHRRHYCTVHAHVVHHPPSSGSCGPESRPFGYSYCVNDPGPGVDPSCETMPILCGEGETGEEPIIEPRV